MWLDLELAIRFLRRRAGLLLRGTALAALAGVSLATLALVVTLALMEGYTQAIAGALQQGNAHLVGFSPQGLAEEDAIKISSLLGKIDKVTRATPVTYLAALAEDPEDPSRPIPIVLKAVADPPSFVNLENWPEGDRIVSIVGIGLARSLGITVPGDLIIQLPPAAGSWVLPILHLEVVETFSLSFTEFDDSWVVVPLQRILSSVPGVHVAGIEVEIEDALEVEAVRGKLESAAPELVFTDWREMNHSLFAALRWQTLSLFVVLTLVVAVASFQVSSALVVLSIDKRRTAGMLQALGATPIRIWRVLVFAGVLLGSAGIAAGLVSGTLVCYLLSVTRAVRFPEHLARVYLVDHVPFVVMPVHLLAVTAVCFLLVVAASAWPALKSARQDPAEALRAV